MKAICQTLTLTHLSLKKNFLGISLKGNQAPICVLSNLLLKSTQLEEVDISYNQIEAKSIFCLSQALQYNNGLKYISLEGNPIGQTGMRFIMNA